MNRTLKCSLAASLAFVGASMFVACGDDSGSNSKKNDSHSSVNEYDDLPVCDSANDAEKATKGDDATIYVCKDDNWEIFDTSFVANDTAKTLGSIPNCADEQNGNSYYIENSGVNYICENERWEIVIVKKEDAKSSSSVTSGKEDGKFSSSKGDSKSSSSTAKSSASTAKSSTSKDPDVIPGTDPEPQGGTSASSASKDDGKSSSSTAKSSASKDPDVIPGTDPEPQGGTSASSASKDDGKSSNSETEEPVVDKNKLPNCVAEIAGEVYYVESEDANYVCGEDRRWYKTEVCGTKAIDTKTQFCIDGEVYDLCGTSDYDPSKEFCSGTIIEKLCGGKVYDPSSEKCINDLVREIKEGFDTLYVFTYEYSWAKGATYYYTDGESAYMDEVDSYDSQRGCVSNSSTAYVVGKYYSYESAEQAKNENCSDDDFSDCKMQVSLYFFSVKDGTHKDANTCMTPIDGGYRVVKNWWAKFNSEFTYDDFVKTYAPSSCNGTTYHIQDAFCYNGEILDLCYGTSYNPDKEFCHDGKYGGGSVVPLCKGEKYDANELFCYNDELMEACGGDPYDPETEFCFYNEEYDYYDLYPLCDGKEYDATNLFCYEGATYRFEDYHYDYDAGEYNTKYPKADYIYVSYNLYGWDVGFYPRSKYGECKENLLYVLGEEECVDGNVVKIETAPTCGTETYDPAKEFCAADEIYRLCGDATYDPVNQFCAGDKVVDLCGGATYDPATQFCFEGDAYANDTHAQCNNKIVDKLETGVCLSDGSYMAMPAELYIVNDLVKMSAYIKRGSLEIWHGNGVSTPEIAAGFVDALKKYGYEEGEASDIYDGSDAVTYVKTVGSIKYSFALVIRNENDQIATVKGYVGQGPAITLE